MKPKATFLMGAGAEAGTSTEAQSKKEVDESLSLGSPTAVLICIRCLSLTDDAKPSTIAANSFIQPLAKDDAPRRQSSGFSFVKFQSKSRNSGESSGKSSRNTRPLALTGMKPFLGKVFAQPLSKKIICTTRNADKATLLKSQEKKGVLLSFRADTKSSVAKKRKATDSIGHRDGKSAFSCKNGRGKSLLLENSVANKDKEKQAGVQVDNTGWKDGIRSAVPFAFGMGKKSKKVDDGAVLKKRGLLVASTIVGPPLKKSKHILPTGVLLQ